MIANEMLPKRMRNSHGHYNLKQEKDQNIWAAYTSLEISQNHWGCCQVKDIVQFLAIIYISPELLHSLDNELSHWKERMMSMH